MKEETKNIDAVFILEIIGKPKEYLVETLNAIIEQMSKEKGVTIKNKKINEPVPMKEKIGVAEKGKVIPEDFYTTFAEVEVETEGILYFSALLFRYMPSHVEIISPELSVLSNSCLNEIFNELTRRLHAYDEVARVMQVEKGILENKLKAVLGEKGKEDKKE